MHNVAIYKQHALYSHKAPPKEYQMVVYHVIIVHRAVNRGHNPLHLLRLNNMDP